MLCIKRVSHLLHITMIKFFKFGFLIRSSANINIYKIQMSPYYDCLIPSSSPSISARIAPVILRCFAWDRAHSFVSPLNVIFLHTRMKYSFLVFIDCTRVLCAHCNNLCFLVFFELRPRARASAESGRSNRSACICKRTANSKSNASFAFARLRFERECEQNGHRTAWNTKNSEGFFLWFQRDILPTIAAGVLPGRSRDLCIWYWMRFLPFAYFMFFCFVLSLYVSVGVFVISANLRDDLGEQRHAEHAVLLLIVLRPKIVNTNILV